MLAKYMQGETSRAILHSDVCTTKLSMSINPTECRPLVSVQLEPNASYSRASHSLLPAKIREYMAFISKEELPLSRQVSSVKACATSYSSA